VIVTRLAATGALGLAFGLALACGVEAFACSQDDDCAAQGSDGVCQAEGVCSFPTMDCPSGQRYGEHSGSLSGMCVADDGTTGSVADEAGTSGVGPDDDGADTIASLTEVDDDASSDSAVESSDGAVSSIGTSDDGVADSSTGGDAIDPDLLLWLRLDDALDDGLVNDGVLGGVAECEAQGCPVASEGMLGSSGLFDGVDDCAIYPWTPELDLPAFTVALWYAHDHADVGHAALFDKPVGDANYNTWEVYLLDDSDGIRRLHFTVGAPTGGVATIQTEAFADGWMHVAMTFDGAVLRAFVDGAAIMELSASADVIDEPEGVFVGCDDNHGPAPTGFLSGGLDELRLYARVLSDDEIAALAAR
jgi:hypothetical protein